jgi:hypothetical protein
MLPFFFGSCYESQQKDEALLWMSILMYEVLVKIGRGEDSFISYAKDSMNQDTALTPNLTTVCATILYAFLI